MKILRAVFAAILLTVFSGCWHLPFFKAQPAPTNVPTANALGTAEAARLSKASAYAEAARQGNAQNPEGAPKEVVAGSLSVVQANLPAPTAADLAEALKTANQGLTGQLEQAKAGWATAVSEGAALRSQISILQAQVAKERVDAAAELKRQLQAAHDEERRKADSDQRKMIGWIFYGGGALLLAASAAMAFLLSSVPLFGPKAALGVGAAGALLIGSGVALNELLAHPLVIWVTLGSAAAALFGSLGLMYSNHHHLILSQQPATPVADKPAPSAGT